jgi:septum formation protein
MLVLASQSPRRRELLKQAGVHFRVHPAHIPEDPLPGEEPIAYVTRLAREKAEAVFRELTDGGRRNGEEDASEPVAATGESPGAGRLAVLGADTTVTLDNQILGKPSDAADAARMLRLLSGRSHRVVTGVALATSEGPQMRVDVAAEVTAVRFLTLSDEEIAAYIATGEPMDKAGAYAVQGGAARWIPRIEGCYFNVMGLPVALVCALLEGRWGGFGLAP